MKALKKSIHLQYDKVQCQEMRKTLPSCLGWDRFIKAWKPSDLILISCQKVRNRVQRLLFEYHNKAFPYEPVPLLYWPKDTRRQNCLVVIPGPASLSPNFLCPLGRKMLEIEHIRLLKRWKRPEKIKQTQINLLFLSNHVNRLTHSRTQIVVFFFCFLLF